LGSLKTLCSNVQGFVIFTLHYILTDTLQGKLCLPAAYRRAFLCRFSQNNIYIYQTKKTTTMTVILITYCLLIGLLGIGANILIKINSLKSKAAAANTPFTVKAYFGDDWPTILLSLLFLFACIIATDEILNWKPEIINYIKVAYFFVGYSGSSLCNALLSKAEKRIMNIIDEKTNIADNITNKTP
jgi:hypothetical protein